ncbi:MAG TPA: hypothetical protein VEV85_04090 [Bryobacteraceae bacterium]|nr:hypothetical protein [Bryobacteraceae bacterium]
MRAALLLLYLFADFLLAPAKLAGVAAAIPDQIDGADRQEHARCAPEQGCEGSAHPSGGASGRHPGQLEERIEVIRDLAIHGGGHEEQQKNGLNKKKAIL